MFNGNFYGVVIAMLMLLISFLLTMKQVEQGGLYVQLIIRPIAIASLDNEHPRDAGGGKPHVRLPADEAEEDASSRIAAKPHQQMTQ